MTADQREPNKRTELIGAISNCDFKKIEDIIAENEMNRWRNGFDNMSAALESGIYSSNTIKSLCDTDLSEFMNGIEIIMQTGDYTIPTDRALYLIVAVGLFIDEIKKE